MFAPKSRLENARIAARSARQIEASPLFVWAGLEAAPEPVAFDPQKVLKMALGVWGACSPVAGTLGEVFFITRRLAVPGPDVVRFHRSLKFGNTRAPGLVWLLCDQRAGEACGVMRVYLDSDGTMIGRRALGHAVGAVPRPP